MSSSGWATRSDRSERRQWPWIAASVVCLMVMAAAGPVETGMAQGTVGQAGRGSISGCVTIQGMPAASVDVELRLMPHGDVDDEAIARTRTDNRGCYRFDGLASGFYWLSVNSPGLLNRDGLAREGGGRRIGVADGAKVDRADLNLILGGAISGRIIDESGQPVEGVAVRVHPVIEHGLPPVNEHGLLPSPLLAGGEFTSDRDGAYRIVGIPAGRYVVSAGVDVGAETGQVRSEDGSHMVLGRIDADQYFEQRFSPGTADRSAARIIDIALGSNVNGADIRLGKRQRTFRATGRMVDALTGEPLRERLGLKFGVEFQNGFTSFSDGEDESGDDGSFEFKGLLPAHFRVTVDSDPDGELFSEKIAFEVTEHDVSGLVVRVSRGLAVQGSVVVEDADGTDALAKRTGLLLTGGHDDDRPDSAGMFRQAIVNADGTFRMTGLARGLIEINVSGQNGHWFDLTRIEWPAVDGGLVTATGVRAGVRACMVQLDRNLDGARIVLRYRGGSIHGHVDVKGSLPAETELFARLTGAAGEGATEAHLDANNNFSWEGLDPGQYQASVGVFNAAGQSKALVLKKNEQGKVMFTIDASTAQRTQ